MSSMKEIAIHTDYIKLGQLMKLAGWIQNGSDAKMYLAEGWVRLNGEIANQRGKKVYPGDEVAVNLQGKMESVRVRAGGTP